MSHAYCMCDLGFDRVEQPRSSTEVYVMEDLPGIYEYVSFNDIIIFSSCICPLINSCND